MRDQTLPVVALAASADEAARREVASVVAALPDDLLAQTIRVRARSMDSITLSLVDGREIRWGSSDESDRKVQVLAILLKQRASVYDVSVPEQPTTRK
jgi:cell division protein FtsQ